jgi:eukaryotic-like serine/threonine-protein kinase
VAKPAEMLLGHTLSTGWKVVERREKKPEGTGGNFSEGYIVESPEGKRAFLKALDFSRAMMMPDWPRWLQAMLQAYNFERDILARCRGERMDRVATPIEDGDVDVDASSPIGRVPYLIFELADGDVRRHVSAFDNLDIAWALRTMHQIATGVLQLHRRQIAHQDLKPSNVLVFGSASSKIGDLGCASTRGSTAPRDALRIAGDPSYAPPELLYGFVPAEWDDRRLGCDLYLVGSMAVFMFTNVGMTPLLLSHLDYSMHPEVWQGDFRTVLPHLQASFAVALTHIGASVRADLSQDLVEMIRQLCEPNPSRRAYGRLLPGRASVATAMSSMERVVSHFDLLARRAERGIISRRR